MKIINLIKRVVVSVLTFTLLITAISFLKGPVKASAATDEVSMYTSLSKYTYHSTPSNTIFLKVKNIAYEKKVTIHYSSYNGWVDEPARYVKSLGDGYEIWEATVGVMGGFEYAIKYEVDGKTFWDNNWNNYNNGDLIGVGYSSVLPLVITSNNTATTQIAFNKSSNIEDVKVFYSEENWVTTNEKDMVYNSTYSSYKNYDYYNTDIYLGSIENLQYKISYNINGVNYIDDNFGRCYAIDFVKTY